MATIHVDIVSAEGEIFSGAAAMVYAPAAMGDLGIAPRHAPLLTKMRPGEVRVEEEGGEMRSFFVGGGMLEVQPHVVTVLADTASRSEDLDEAAAAAAEEAAKQAMLEAKGDKDIAAAQQELAQAAARVQMIKKLRDS